MIVDGASAPLRDVILYPGGVRSWDWRESHSGHLVGVQPSAVAELVERGARVVVLATGVLGLLRIAPETLRYLEQNGIRVHRLRTPAAVKRYNVLAARAPVGALIHSTC